VAAWPRYVLVMGASAHPISRPHCPGEVVPELNSDRQELLARHRAVLPSWLALYYEDPIELVRGDGRHVWDGEGKRYLDFFGGILTTMTGHNVAEVVDAIQGQAARIVHTSTLYLIRPMIELAERIASLAPMDDAKVFFVNSGSEANDTALQLATTWNRTNQVLALRNSYHGRTVSTQAVTGNRYWSATPWSAFNVTYAPNGDNLRGPFRGLSGQALVDACVEELCSVVATATTGTIACMIAEPIQGVGGFTTPPDGLFAAYKEILDEHGALWISDEVQTGWGRTGEHFWGIDAHGVTPDIVTFAKGVGNGLALGGVIARPDVMDCISANSISTFGGNPLVTAGALANLDYLLDHELQENAAERGRQLMQRLEPLVDKLAAVFDVRGKGLMVGVELVEPGTTEPSVARTSAVLEMTRERGLLLGKGGLHGNVIRVVPPLSVTAEETEEACDILVGVLEEAAT